MSKKTKDTIIYTPGVALPHIVQRIDKRLLHPKYLYMLKDKGCEIDNYHIYVNTEFIFAYNPHNPPSKPWSKITFKP